MNTYLPADFYRLHDAGAEDWRDASSAPFASVVATPFIRGDAQRERERIVDPCWVAL